MKNLATFLFFALIPTLANAQNYEPPNAQDDDDEVEEAPSKIDQVGVTLAVGVGYGGPLGDAYKAENVSADSSLGSIVAAQVPVVLGLGVRPVRYLSVGMAFQYAPLVTKNCDTGATCSASDTYLGAELRLHLAPGRLVCPWMSFGVGYEWLSLTESGSHSMDGGFRGWDYAFELGTDISVTRSLALGPYLGVRFGKYGTVSGGGFSSTDQSIPDNAQATHGWWVVGIRGAFTISQP